MKAMLGAAVEGSLSRNRAVGTKLICISEKEAIRIGKNLVPSLMTEQLATAGVNEWRVQNRAVKELMAEQVWFEPMIIILSKGIVKTAAWGLMARVIIGAVLSVTDLATDIVVLKQFWDGGEEQLAFRNASLASLSASIGLQLMVVVIQNRKKGIFRILKECLIVLTGSKAPVDAYKIAMGAEQEKDTLIDPMTEMTANKLVEVFAESIPGIIIQLNAIISTINSGEKEVTTTAYLSLLVSLLSTGFISATLSYDFDTDPQKRAFNPEFYGYAPDDGRKRAFLFFTMILLSATQVLIKAILIIVLASIGSWFSLYYLLGDIAFYLLYKLARRDLTYWVPLEGVLGLIISGLFRVVIKFVVDFTAIIQFRHPYDVSNSMAHSMWSFYSNHNSFSSGWRVIFFTELVSAASWASICVGFRFGEGKSF